MKSEQYVTTQRTAKSFKLQSLLSVLMMFLGAIMAMQVEPSTTGNAGILWGSFWYCLDLSGTSLIE